MRVYYDDQTGDVLFTLIVPENTARTPPGPFIEIPEQTFDSLSAWRVVDGQLVLVDIAPYRATAIQRVNARAGEVRAGFLTDIIGQEMLYKAKEEEARSYVLESPEPASLTDYPLIAAEVGITAATAYQLAQVWLYMGAQWRGIAAQIETARLGAIAQIGVAASEADITAIEATYLAAMVGAG